MSGFKTTGIGSLPHHNVDSALKYAFEYDIPYLPQIPRRNPHEYMVYQALEGLPGLALSGEFNVTLDIDKWSHKTQELRKRLDAAFDSTQSSAFEAFEPTAHALSAWKPFIWELDEQKVKRAKIQIAGPLTCQWALKISDQSKVENHPDLAFQIFRLILARGIAMVRRLENMGVEPILFLDEPGLYLFSSNQPKQMLALQELKIVIQTLKNEGAQVGIHCCSNTDWPKMMDLGLTYVALDTKLSLELFLSNKDAATKCFEQSGRLCLGVIPTELTPDGDSQPVKKLYVDMVETIKNALGEEKTLEIMSSALYSPACGLALHPVESTEEVLKSLRSFQDLAKESVH